MSTLLILYDTVGFSAVWNYITPYIYILFIQFEVFCANVHSIP